MERPYVRIFASTHINNLPLKCLVSNPSSIPPSCCCQDDAPALDFVTAAANLRMHIFSMNMKSRFDIKCKPSSPYLRSSCPGGGWYRGLFWEMVVKHCYNNVNAPYCSHPEALFPSLLNLLEETLRCMLLIMKRWSSPFVAYQYGYR